MPPVIRISKDIDSRIYSLARNYYQDGKKQSKERLPELRTMVSGNMEDGSQRSLVVKIIPNPINPRLSSGWKVVAEDKVWEIPPEDLEKSRLL